MFGQSWVDFGVVVPPGLVVTPGLLVAAGAGEAGTGDDADERSGGERSGGLLGLRDVADPRLEVVVDSLEVGRGGGVECRSAGDLGDVRQRGPIRRDVDGDELALLVGDLDP